MASAIFIKSIILSLSLAYTETNYHLSDDTNGPFGLSTFFPITPTLLTGLCFWILMYGFKVGAARKKYIALAKKDGEKDIEERYAYPNLYAQGTSKHVLAFNCVQRSHQQIFEAINTVILTSLVAAIHYPLTSAFWTFIHFCGRVSLSHGYANANGDASKRYSCPLAKYNWYGILGNVLLSLVACANMILDKKLL